MGKAGGGSIRVEINLVMSEEGPMQQASISEAAHAKYGNPSNNFWARYYLELEIHNEAAGRCVPLFLRLNALRD